MKYFQKIVVIIGLWIVMIPNGEARHIIGGDISYKCNAPGNYTFLFTIYRDCGADGAQFDDPAVFTIFEGSGPFYSLVESLNIPKDGPDVLIPIPENDCQETSNLCVERNSYTFTINLPISASSYHIVYQRCCRNNTITNIVNPFSTGATYTIELLPAAQQVCNNSPVFTEYPPALVCAQQPLVYDHSAVDVEGDQLIYRFCNPLDGGGLSGVDPPPPVGDASACDGVQPNPACPPPFDPVAFKIPTFSETNPMGGSPQISISSSTGLITGTPEFVGQYVVGVCVEEYRNGVLLSRTLRDFQFNVDECVPFVQAYLQNGTQVGDTIFLTYCGETDVTINNLSFQQSKIEDFSWTLDSDGDGLQEAFTEWSPSVSFPDYGTYEGYLYLFGENNCNDSAYVKIDVYPDLFSEFSFAYDTCVAGPTTFTNFSYTEAQQIDGYLWDFGDGTQSMMESPVHEYMIPGDHEISLIITDNNGCMDTFMQTINYYPVPALVVIDPSALEACAPQEVLIDNLSFPIDESYDILWDLGDGNFSTDISPVHLYEEVGDFSLFVEITSPLGCNTSASWADLIKMRPTPEAGFTFTPNFVTEQNSTVEFFDESVDADFYSWDFSNESTSFNQNPVYTFQDTGLQVITQIVEHSQGCQDTLQRLIDVVPFFNFNFPNAFSPNGDGLNEFFLGKGYQKNVLSFRMAIYNRWGELVFETKNPEEGWNGKKLNVGRDSPEGVYAFVADVFGPRGITRRFEGVVALVR
ncbi:MAG: T9SS type B sorting domain-containing protein [Saprospiraceae bacterium]|nr:T9SS type B sorting domain-containing protein [Saprospiraceae bacterium]